ncbi:hypothetical protein CDAR_7511 [Caerostris darwini]|uniref:Uncharacterized protein n=1 Tax=Caerostris darwini TaxID=1538125 RepID=A0AAV4R5Y9_9ARAC|nr:hypothetical protein CDAR_7511 [Caerostris darwini]
MLECYIEVPTSNHSPETLVSLFISSTAKKNSFTHPQIHFLPSSHKKFPPKQPLQKHVTSRLNKPDGAVTKQKQSCFCFGCFIFYCGHTLPDCVLPNPFYSSYKLIPIADPSSKRRGGTDYLFRGGGCAQLLVPNYFVTELKA